MLLGAGREEASARASGVGEEQLGAGLQLGRHRSRCRQGEEQRQGGGRKLKMGQCYLVWRSCRWRVRTARCESLGRETCALEDLRHLVCVCASLCMSACACACACRVLFV